MHGNKQKALWERLAKKNPKYYIVSDYGREITNDQFIQSAIDDYNSLILKDNLLMKGHGTILDVGCGIGRLSGIMLTDYDKVIGIDISGEMIRQAQKRLDMYGSSEFIETDGETIPLPDNSIDVAFSYLVFQHMKTTEMVNRNFDEVYRVLKPKGVFKVLVRTDTVDVNRWWGGVTSDETYPISIGFTLLRKEKVKDHGLWLWLQK